MWYSGVQGGWRAGWRMGVLAFTFTAVCQSLTVVRQYINPLDFALAGGVMGGVYKLHMGPRGMVGAGLAGSLLGLQSGKLQMETLGKYHLNTFYKKTMLKDWVVRLWSNY